MTETEPNFFKNPTKPQMILITVLWFIGVLLLVLATTDLFRESILQQKYMLTNLLIVGSTGTFYMSLRNYLLNRDSKKST